MYSQIIALLLSVVNARYECSDSTVVNTTMPKTDYVFLVDNSGSMGSSITGVMSGLSAFADKVKNSNQDYSFSYVVFGGVPKIRVPFTTDIDMLKTAMSQDAEAHDGGGQEASFEAIRMVLRNDPSLQKKCLTGVSNAACTINFRSGATKVIMLATDEDSDLPNLSANREPNQESNTFCHSFYSATTMSCNSGAKIEPGFDAVFDFVPKLSNNKWVLDTTKRNYYRNSSELKLATPYETELQKTADLLLSQGVIINSLISLKVGANDFDSVIKLPISSWGPSSNYFKYQKQTRSVTADSNTVARYQFGDPALQVQSSDFNNFNSEQTLAALRTAGLGNSLQARMLTGNGFMRIFDIALFANGVNQQLVNAFYEQMIKTTVSIQQRCVFIPDPVPTVAPVETTVLPSATEPIETEPTDVVVAPDAPEDVPINQVGENDSGSAAVVIAPVVEPIVVVAEPEPAPQETTNSEVDVPAQPVEPTNEQAEKPQESSKPTEQPNMTPVAVAVPVAAVGAAAVLFMFYRKRSQVAKTVAVPEDSFENSLSNNPLYNQLGTARDNPLFQSVASIGSSSRNDFAV